MRAKVFIQIYIEASEESIQTQEFQEFLKNFSDGEFDRMMMEPFPEGKLDLVKSTYYLEKYAEQHKEVNEDAEESIHAGK